MRAALGNGRNSGAGEREEACRGDSRGSSTTRARSPHASSTALHTRLWFPIDVHHSTRPASVSPSIYSPRPPHPFSAIRLCSSKSFAAHTMAMLLKASAALALLSASSEALQPPSPAVRPSFSSSFAPFRSPRRMNRRVSTAVAAGSNHAITGVVFQPFEEIKSDVSLVPVAPDLSIARHKYADECEAAINVQIKSVLLTRTYQIRVAGDLIPFSYPLSVCVLSSVEYTNSYIYHALFAYFDRDNVALKGFAKFFKESSQEERDHAEKLMEYQSFYVVAAMELALCLEKLTNEKLLGLHDVSNPSLNQFFSSIIQVEAIKKISEYVAQLRRVGKGHGEVFLYIRQL
ncbi:hypothetical protein BHM03_00001256, partial [Ensete ventricosum]